MVNRKLTQFGSSIHLYSIFGNSLGAQSLLEVAFRAMSRQVDEHESDTFGHVITYVCTGGRGKYTDNATDTDSVAVARSLAVPAHDVTMLFY